MLTIENVVFMIGVLGSIYCLGFQLYNVLSSGKEYDLRSSFMYLFGFILSFGLVFLVATLDPETLIYSSLLFYEQGFLILSFVLFFAELMLFFKNGGVTPRRSGDES